MLILKKKRILKIRNLFYKLILLIIIAFGDLNVNAQNNKDSITLQYEDLSVDYYLIGSGDILKVIFFGAPEFSSDYKVLNDGTINFPLIGRVQMRGKSIEEASKVITDLYKDELIQPQIYLKIEYSRPIKVSIYGEISRPGLYKLDKTENEINNSAPTLVDIIREAGGLTKDADLMNIFVKRRLPNKEESYKTTKLNLYDLITKGDQKNNLYLFDGDVIQIKKAKTTKKDFYKISRSNLAPDKINVTVVGQVKNPGILNLKSNTPLTQAIFSAGGVVDWKANTSNIQLIRINENGSAFLKRYKIDLSNPVSNKHNPLLKDGDIIKVNMTNSANITNGLEVILKPLLIPFQLFDYISD